MVLKVGVNGYGTIGKRVVDAIKAHEKLELVGIGKYLLDADTILAAQNRIRIYTPSARKKAFTDRGVDIEGTVEDLVKKSDVIVDASSDGKGEENRKTLYEPKGRKAIFQGGEEPSVGDISFNARCNFREAAGKKYIRVVSCNTTSLCRIIKPVTEKYKVKSIQVVLIRRSTDPHSEKGGPLNSVVWTSGVSHHGEDIESVIGRLPITTVEFKVPHTLMHVNHATITFQSKAPSLEEFRSLLENEGRIAMLNNAKSTSEIVEVARDLGLKRRDLYTVNVLVNTFHQSEDCSIFAFTVPQESIVVPENIDAIVAQSELMDAKSSIKFTDNMLGISSAKKNLEDIFA